MLLQPTNSCKPQHIYLVGLVPCRAGLQRKTTQEENHAGSSWETKGEAAGSMYRLTDFKESNLSSSGARTCACIAFAAFLLTGALFFGGSSSSASTGDGCSGEPEVVDEVLEGTPCADVIVAPEGVTSIEGGSGNDTIVAGDGVVEISGGPGSDLLVGSSEVEVITGGDGSDIIFGDSLPADLPRAEIVAEEVSEGASVSAATNCDNWDDPNSDLGDVNLGTGDDFCRGGDGNQIIYGGTGADMIFGERGNDELWGQDGNDRLYGSVGDDFLAGNYGDDLLAGGNGSDNAQGGPDNDLVRGDTVGDVRKYDDTDQGHTHDGPAGLSGGAGDNDTISFASAVAPGFENGQGKIDPSTLYFGFPGTPDERGVYVDLAATDSNGQTIQIADNGSNKNGGGSDEISEFENVIGSPYADYIEGNNSTNIIQGGGGPDAILGQGGNDTLYGGADSDHLDGGTQTDTVRGESGAFYTGAADFTNSCFNAELPASRPDCARTFAGSIFRNRNYLSVGVVGVGRDTSARKFSEVYVSGSLASDNITTSFNADTQVLTFTSGGTPFDPTQQQGCTLASSTVATCDLTNTGPLDLINYYGGADDDNLSAFNAGLPVATSNFILGGLGGDTDLKGTKPRT